MFVRFYSHLVVTLARNATVHDHIRTQVSECLDLQLKTSEMVVYQSLKQAIADGQNLRRCFNCGLLLLAQKLL